MLPDGITLLCKFKKCLSCSSFLHTRQRLSAAVLYDIIVADIPKSTSMQFFSDTTKVVPPKVENTLSEFGRSMVPVPEAMCTWSKGYLSS